MTSKQESRFSMQLVARDYLIQNSSITATLPNFAESFTPLQTDITQISVIRQQQELDKKGLASKKRQLRIKLITQTADISRKVIAYASYINNTVLLNEVNYTDSDLKNSPDTILKDRCQVIYNKALENLTALQPYGVSDTLLTTLLDTINNYYAAIPTPRLSTLSTKEATRQLALLLKNIDLNYLKIDTLVEILRESNPIFYNQYKSARKIIYQGTHTTALSVTVKDTDGNGIAKVSAKITNIPKNPNSKEVINEISKKTTTKGAFKIASLAEGNYKANFTKMGFESQIINFSIVSGETTKIDLIMIN